MDIKARVQTDWSQPKKAAKEYTDEILQSLARIDAAGRRAGSSGDVGGTRSAQREAEQTGAAVEATRRAAVASGAPQQVIDQLSSLAGLVRQTVEQISKPFGNVAAALRTYDAAVVRGADGLEKAGKTAKSSADKSEREARKADAVKKKAADDEAKAQKERERADKRHADNTKASQERKNKRANDLVTDPALVKLRQEEAALRQKKIQEDKRFKAEARDPEFEAATRVISAKKSSETTGRYYDSVLRDEDGVRRAIAEAGVKAKRGEASLNAESARYRQRTPGEEAIEFVDIGTDVADKRRRKAAELAETERQTIPFLQQINRDTAEAEVLARRRKAALAAQINTGLKGAPDIFEAEARNQVDDRRNKARVAASAAQYSDSDPLRRQLEISDNATAAASKRKQAIETSLATERRLAGDVEKMASQVAETEKLQRLRKLATRQAVAATFSQAEAEKKAQVTVKEQANAERDKLALLRAQTATYRATASTDAALARTAKEELKVKNDILIESRRLRDLEKQRIEAAIRSGDISGGTRFQRVQQRMAARSGGPERLPEEFQTITQFLSSKALTSAGFALSGAVLYGGVTAMKEMVKEASELDKELRLIDSLLRDAGRGDQFDGLKKAIMDVSIETGVAADQLAKVERSLLGVFRVRDETKPLEEQDQGPNVPASTEALKVAAKFSAVTGVDPKLITDELVAIFKSFEDVEKGISFQSLADALVAVEDESSVAAESLLEIAGSLAPIVSQFGISSEELIRYSAAATQGSALSPSATADGLNRFLTDLVGKKANILDIYQQSDIDPQQAIELQKKFKSGDMSKVIDQLIRDYQELSPDLKLKFNRDVIGKKDAKAVVGLFENPTLALRDVDSRGALNERWNEVRDTLITSMQQLRTSFEELATKIFDAGLGDVLKNLAIVTGGVVEAFTKLLGLFLFANDKLGGLITQGVGAFGAVIALQALGRKGQALRKGGFLRRGVEAAVEGAVEGSVLVDPSGNPFPRGKPVPELNRRQRAKAAVGANAGVIGASLLLMGVSSLLEARSAAQAEQGDIQTEIATYSGQQLRQGAGLRDSNFQRIMNYFGGTKDTDKLYLDEIQKRTGPGKATVLSSLSADEYAAAVDAMDLPSDMADKLKSTEGRNELSNKLKAGSRDDKVAEAYNAIIANYEANGPTSQQYKDAVSAGGVQTDQINAGVAASDSLEEASQKVELQIEALKAGDATYGEVSEAIADRTAKLQAMVDGANAAGAPDPEIEKLLAQSEAQAAQIADLTFGGYAEQAKAILELRGDIGKAGNEKAMEIDRFLLSGFGEGISSELRASTAMDLAARQKAAFEFEISQAQGVNEAIQAYRDGLANYDPVARFEVLKSQVAAPLNSDNLAVLGGDVDSVTEQVKDYLDAGIEVSIDNIQAKIKLLQDLNVAADNPEMQRLVAMLQVLSGIEDPAQWSKDYADATAFQGYQQAQAGISGQLALDNSATYNSIDQAANAEAAAKKVLDQAKILDAQVGTVESGAALIAAEAAYNEAVKGTAKAHDSLDSALLGVAAAQAAGDPVAAARVAVQQAQLAMIQAHGDPILEAQAQAMQIAARKAGQDAANDIERARMELAAAQNEGDPIALAQSQLDLANFNVSVAKGEAEKLRALAAQISAKRALSDAINEVMSGFYDVAIATREAAGDAVGAAKLQLERIEKFLASARANGDKSGELELIAQKVQAEAAIRDANLADKTSDIDFALQMEKITTGQAIQELELLLKIPNLTKQQIQELQLKIKSLRDGSGLSQFNTPSELNLPTVYEVRRLDQLNGGTYQSARTGYEGGTNNSNNDNRQINITIHAKNTVEAEAALKVVKESLGSAPRTGVDYKLY